LNIDHIRLDDRINNVS